MSEVHERLFADDFVNARGQATPRWHAAVARAATQLLSRGEDLEDLRVPVACALLDHYGLASDETLVEMVAVMTPLTAISPRTKQAGPNGGAGARTEG